MVRYHIVKSCISVQQLVFDGLHVHQSFVLLYELEDLHLAPPLRVVDHEEVYGVVWGGQNQKVLSRTRQTE